MPQSSPLFIGLIVALAGCVPASNIDLVNRCILSQGIEPARAVGGFYSPSGTSIEDAIVFNEQIFDLTPSQRATARACAESRRGVN